MTLARVVWLDSHVCHGWDVARGDGLDEIMSAGILVADNRYHIILSTSRSANGMFVDQLVIPKKSVISFVSHEVRPKVWLSG